MLHFRLFVFIVYTVLKPYGSAQIWHVYSALLTTGKQRTTNKPILLKRLVSIWLAMSVSEQNIPGEELVVRGSFPSQKQLNAYVTWVY